MNGIGRENEREAHSHENDVAVARILGFKAAEAICICKLSAVSDVNRKLVISVNDEHITQLFPMLVLELCTKCICIFVLVRLFHFRH